ncbi:hypothetical protein [Rhodoferax ferrireducens]|uniref:hypothetical protein n=1 Tax=Rhodoferax ferrireducens TaxID=192843 RepID=UPI00140FCC1C|nr:hypothetical protein [Rhodoferax ferrireducens]
MSTFEASLQRREEVAQGTLAFHFEKPAGFRFKPGQGTDVVGLTRPPSTPAVKSFMVTDGAGPLDTSRPGFSCGLKKTGTPAARRPSNGQDQP